MRCFYSSPGTKPLYPVFQLAMIASHNDEEYQKARKGHIPKLIPLLLKQHDGCGGADDKNGQPPSRILCAGLSGTMQQTVDPRHEAKERSISV